AVFTTWTAFGGMPNSSIGTISSLRKRLSNRFVPAQAFFAGNASAQMSTISGRRGTARAEVFYARAERERHGGGLYLCRNRAPGSADALCARAGADRSGHRVEQRA